MMLYSIRVGSFPCRHGIRVFNSSNTLVAIAKQASYPEMHPLLTLNNTMSAVAKEATYLVISAEGRGI
jgi:hypothetical protein